MGYSEKTGLGGTRMGQLTSFAMLQLSVQTSGGKAPVEVGGGKICLYLGSGFHTFYCRCCRIQCES